MLIFVCLLFNKWRWSCDFLPLLPTHPGTVDDCPALFQFWIIPELCHELRAFAVKIENTSLNSCNLLISFNVKSLFTSVLIDEAMSKVAALLLADSSLEDRTTMSPETICRRTELCLCTTYFEFQEVFTNKWMELL